MLIVSIVQQVVSTRLNLILPSTYVPGVSTQHEPVLVMLKLILTPPLIDVVVKGEYPPLFMHASGLCTGFSANTVNPFTGTVRNATLIFDEPTLHV